MCRPTRLQTGESRAAHESLAGKEEEEEQDYGLGVLSISQLNRGDTCSIAVLSNTTACAG